MPDVSVIIPTYNYAQFLAESIQSVLQQTYSEFELLVVDDGSTDQTRQVVAQFESDPRVRYLFQENRGDAAARNTGINHTTGRFVAFLDSDDLWLPEKLARQVEVLQLRPEISVVYTAIVLQQIDEQRRLPPPPAWRESTLYEELLYRNVITGSHSSVMIRREVFEQVGLFDDAFRISDRDLWRRLAERHGFYRLDEPLVCIRKHEDNSSRNKVMMADNHLRYFAKLQRDILPEYRHHLPRVAIWLFTGLTLGLLRRGKLRSACRTGWMVLSHVCRSPDAVTSLMRQWWRGLAARARLPGDTR